MKIIIESNDIEVKQTLEKDKIKLIIKDQDLTIEINTNKYEIQRIKTELE